MLRLSLGLMAFSALAGVCFSLLSFSHYHPNQVTSVSMVGSAAFMSTVRAGFHLFQKFSKSVKAKAFATRLEDGCMALAATVMVVTLVFYLLR